MPETVCVTVEQLITIEHVDDGDGHLRCPQCERTSGHDLTCWLGNAIAQADRLRDWKPNVGDRVRLKTMPEAGVWRIGYLGVGAFGERAYLVNVGNEKTIDTHRYLAELMPEEETK